MCVNVGALLGEASKCRCASSCRPQNDTSTVEKLQNGMNGETFTVPPDRCKMLNCALHLRPGHVIVIRLCILKLNMIRETHSVDLKLGVGI